MSVVQLKDSEGHSIYPIMGRLGETWFSIDGTVPVGGIPYDGRVIVNGKILYHDLWDYVTSNNLVVPALNGKTSEQRWQEKAQSRDGDCNLYADHGGNDFRMPRITHWLAGGLPEGKAPESFGGKDYVKQTLPNIKGNFSSRASYYDSSAKENGYTSTNGVFSWTGGSSNTIGSETSSNHGGTIYFDASKFSNKTKVIYKDNADVQPNTNRLLLGVYATDVIKGVGSVEATDIANKLTAMDTKFNTMGIVSTEFKVPTDLNGSFNRIKFGNGLQICYGNYVVNSSKLILVAKVDNFFYYEASAPSQLLDVGFINGHSTFLSSNYIYFYCIVSNIGATPTGIEDFRFFTTVNIDLSTEKENTTAFYIMIGRWR